MRGGIFINGITQGLANYLSYVTSEDQALIEIRVTVEDSKVSSRSWLRRDTYIVGSTINENVFVGFRCQISNAYIGEGCQIASRTVIGKPGGKQSHIDRFTWIGAQAEIAEGVAIGEGCVIGAGAFVDCDIPPYSIVIGRPAKIIKQRAPIEDKHPDFGHFLSQRRQILKEKEQIENHVSELLEYFDVPGCDRYPERIRSALKLQSAVSLGKKCFWDATIEAKGPATIGESVLAIGKQIRTPHGGLITDGGILLGGNVSIGCGSILEGGGKISIGDDSRLGKHVHIVSTGHNYNYLSLPMTFMPVTIGKDVKIGDDALILGGVTIGDGAVIHSNAIIYKNVEPYEEQNGHLRKGV